MSGINSAVASPRNVAGCQGQVGILVSLPLLDFQTDHRDMQELRARIQFIYAV